MFKEWLSKTEGTYLVDVTDVDGGSSFVDEVYHFSDPRGTGTGFTVTLNDSGEPSSFDMDTYHFGDFNIAEYVDSKDILRAADIVLSGLQEVRRDIFGMYRGVFYLDSYKGKSKRTRVYSQPHSFTKR